MDKKLHIRPTHSHPLKKNKYFKNIERILKEWNPELVLVGLPINMDGTEQPITERARNFAYCIQKYFDVKITLHDERLSTVEARSYLFDIGGLRAIDKCSIDSTSALIILESWFYGER